MTVEPVYQLLLNHTGDDWLALAENLVIAATPVIREQIADEIREWRDEVPLPKNDYGLFAHATASTIADYVARGGKHAYADEDSA